jgi:gliding motility-associated protein GldE
LDYQSSLFVYSSFNPFLLLAVNPQGTTVLVVCLLVFLVLSFFISGAEIAFFSLSHRDVNMLKTKQDTGWKRVVSLLEYPKQLLASLLIANTFVNIAFITFSNFLINQFIDISPWWLHLLVKIIVITSFLLLFGEVLAKVWANQNHLRFAYNSSFVVEIIHLLFRRVAGWLAGFSDGIERLLGGRINSYNYEALESNKVASDEEKILLKGIVKFSNITVKQIMRTRLDVSGIEHGAGFDQLVKRIESLHYSRLPVYKQNLDTIAGVIHAKDVIPHLSETESFNWHRLMRPAYFVHEHKLIEDLLQEFKEKRIHFAIVVDEFGGTSGIVTLEDIMEEVIGEIKDEFDEEETGNRKLDENTYVFEGKTMLNDVCKMMRLPLESFEGIRGDSDSLAGLLLELAGKFPSQNDVIKSGNFEFTILEAGVSRINKIKVAVLENANL